MPRRRAARSEARAKSAASPARRADRLAIKPQRQRSQGHRRLTLAAGAGLVLVSGLIVLGVWTANSPGRLQNRAEAAARAGDWTAALANWRAVNTTALASSSTYLSEARACLALGRAAQAEQSLRRAIAADPSGLGPWQLLLEIFRVEDRGLEAEQMGWEAYAHIRPDERPQLLRELTLSLLADLPDDIVRTTLKRWIEADPADVDAQVALWQRMAGSPRSRSRSANAAGCTRLLAKQPPWSRRRTGSSGCCSG